MVNADNREADDASKPLEPEIRFNRIYICDHINYLLKAAVKGTRAFREMFIHAMKELWRYRQKVYPGRCFERIAKSPNAKYKKTTYNTKAKGES